MTDDSDRRLRILAVTNMWPQDGMHRGNFVQQLVDTIRGLGHEVTVEIVTQSRGRHDYLFAALRLRRLAKRGDYDVAHMHFGMTALAGRFVGIPRVISLYGSDINVAHKRWFTRIGWGGTVRRVYVSRRLAQIAGDHAAQVIPNGVDFNLFTPADKKRSRADLGIQPADRVILFGADPKRAEKGHDVYRGVVGALESRGIDVRELVLTEHGQGDSRVVQKMNAADVLLFTSREGSEGSPSVVKEAIAVGLPVVSVDVGDVAELLVGITPSAVVPFRDRANRPRGRQALIQALADDVVSVLEDGRRADGREQRRWLDRGAVAERMVCVYREAIADFSLR